MSGSPVQPAWCRTTPTADYDARVVEAALDALLDDAGLDPARLIEPGARICVKPNWVSDRNESGQGLDCLVTHPSLIRAVLARLGAARPARVVLGDAPIQGCDFDRLVAACGIREIVADARRGGLPVDLVDFRMVTLSGGRRFNRPVDTGRRPSDYVLFDLATESELEPITTARAEFRVGMYDAEALRRTHAPGRHQYLVAREVIESDLVLSLPKLKTHKRAGITGPLKHFVGAIGHKSYLPHHRKGSPAEGGDCYPDASFVKRLAEATLDRGNEFEGPIGRGLLNVVAAGLVRAGRATGHDGNVHGSWHGNDTVWRMSLDLQRIVRFGRCDGTLAETPQRHVLDITDAVLAGDHEGPLAPRPLPLRMLTLGASPAELEFVHCLLFGMDPLRVPLVREALRETRRRPLVTAAPGAIEVYVDGRRTPPHELFARHGVAATPCAGWVGHCELEERSRSRVS